jgi:tetratricopeptide (TPR) repeat protein
LAVSDVELKNAPTDYRIWTLKGIALQSLARPAEALQAFHEALNLRPDFLPALQAAAQIEYQSNHPNARRTLERVVALRNEPTAHAMLGVLAFERKDCGSSAAHFEKAGGAATGNPIARRQFATCLFELSRYQEAAAQYRALLAEREDDQLRYNLGLALFNARQQNEAIAILEPLLSRTAPDADALSLLASTYEAARRTPDAVRTLKRAIEMHPRNERLYADLATLCLDHSSIATGIEVMTVGVSNIPASASMHTMLGVLYARAGDHDKAAGYYARAVELAPAAGFGAVAQAMTMLQLGAAEEAVKLLRGQRARGANAQVDLALAQALLQAGSEDRHAPEIERLLSGAASAGQPRAHTLLAKMYLRRGDTAGAARSLEAALALDPDDRTAVYQLLTIRRREGKSEEAARLQGRVRQLLEAEKAEEAAAARFQLVQAPEERRRTQLH